MKVKILKSAINDIKEIHGYLNEFGPEPAEKLKLSFKKFCSQVIDTPFLWPVCANTPDYRRAVLEYGYLLFYKVDEKAKLVKIYRVLHGKRNVSLR